MYIEKQKWKIILYLQNYVSKMISFLNIERRFYASSIIILLMTNLICLWLLYNQLKTD